MLNSIVWLLRVMCMFSARVLIVNGTFDLFGRNQLPAILNSSVQQSSLSVEQNSASPMLSTVISLRVLLLSWLEPCSSLTPN